MSLLMLEKPAHVRSLIEHLDEENRLKKMDQAGFFGGSAMLRFASRAFNPRLLNRVPEGCTGAIYGSWCIRGKEDITPEDEIEIVAASCESIGRNLHVTLSAQM